MTPPKLRLVRGMSLLAVFVLAACGLGPSTATPIASVVASAPAASPTSAVIPSAAASSPAGSVVAVGQTDTEWGRIWDTLPGGFPTYPGTTPADEAATGPASGTLVVNGDVAKQVITSMRTSLEAAGFSTTAYSGPLEDGTYVLDLRGATDDCKVNITASPLGSLTTVTILYGAACPHS